MSPFRPGQQRPLDFETLLAAPPLQFDEYLTDRSGPPEPICNFLYAICILLSQSDLHRFLDNGRNRYLRWCRKGKKSTQGTGSMLISPALLLQVAPPRPTAVAPDQGTAPIYGYIPIIIF